MCFLLCTLSLSLACQRKSGTDDERVAAITEAEKAEAEKQAALNESITAQRIDLVDEYEALQDGIFADSTLLEAVIDCRGKAPTAAGSTWVYDPLDGCVLQYSNAERANCSADLWSDATGCAPLETACKKARLYWFDACYRARDLTKDQCTTAGLSFSKETCFANSAEAQCFDAGNYWFKDTSTSYNCRTVAQLPLKVCELYSPVLAWKGSACTVDRPLALSSIGAKTPTQPTLTLGQPGCLIGEVPDSTGQFCEAAKSPVGDTFPGPPLRETSTALNYTCNPGTTTLSISAVIDANCSFSSLDFRAGATYWIPSSALRTFQVGCGGALSPYSYPSPFPYKACTTILAQPLYAQTFQSTQCPCSTGVRITMEYKKANIVGAGQYTYYKPGIPTCGDTLGGAPADYIPNPTYRFDMLSCPNTGYTEYLFGFDASGNVQCGNKSGYKGMPKCHSMGTRNTTLTGTPPNYQCKYAQNAIIAYSSANKITNTPMVGVASDTSPTLSTKCNLNQIQNFFADTSAGVPSAFGIQCAGSTTQTSFGNKDAILNSGFSCLAPNTFSLDVYSSDTQIEGYEMKCSNNTSVTRGETGRGGASTLSCAGAGTQTNPAYPVGVMVKQNATAVTQLGLICGQWIIPTTP